jgi:hypothetical protein
LVLKTNQKQISFLIKQKFNYILMNLFISLNQFYAYFHQNPL